MSWDPAWKRLVESLRAQKVESVYLDRLESRLGDLAAARRAGYGGLEQEIVEEMAFALGRAEDKVNAALLELELAGRALDAAAPADRDRLRAAYNERRAAAATARWELVIHRESLGFVRNDELEGYYPIPPAR